MEFTNTDIKHCSECKGIYKIRLLKIGSNEIALCKDCRDKLYEIVDKEDEIILY